MGLGALGKGTGRLWFVDMYWGTGVILPLEAGEGVASSRRGALSAGAGETIFDWN